MIQPRQKRGAEGKERPSGDRGDASLTVENLRPQKILFLGPAQREEDKIIVQNLQAGHLLFLNMSPPWGRGVSQVIGLSLSLG